MSRPTPDRSRAVDQSDDTLVETPGRSRRRRRRSRVVAAVFVLLALTAVGLYAAGYVMAGDRLPRNAEISGVAVGGLEPGAAQEKLRSSLETRAQQPIKVRVASVADQVQPSKAGLSLDYERSVEQAGGGKSLDPRQIWQVLNGGTALEAVVEVDESRLRGAVDALAKKHNARAKDATLAYRGAKIVATKSEKAVTLDREAAVERLRESYFQTTQTVELPAVVKDPAVTDADVAAVVRSYAKPAVAAPITVRVGRAGSLTVSPAMIGRSVDFVPRNGTVAPRFDGGKLYAQLRPQLGRLDLTQPRNAAVRLVDGRPRVTPSVTGTKVAETTLTKAVQAALLRRGSARTVAVPLSSAPPTFTTAQARQLGIKRVTGEFTTYFPHAGYRNVNISRAASLINQTVLKPGDVFSLNRIVGERTRENGFVEGNIITGGKFRMELGGGVSQSATTTFNAMFFAGLKDIEHQPHTLYIDRYPAGREATVAWPNLDLKFANDTRYGVLVQAFVNRSSPGQRGSITVRMWSTKTYDRVVSSPLRRSNFTRGRDIVDDSPNCQPMSPVPGFDVNYSRLFYRGGTVVKRENFFWRYAPTDRVRCS